MYDACNRFVVPLDKISSTRRIDCFVVYAVGMQVCRYQSQLYRLSVQEYRRG
jgi:hypothetical protein